MIMEQYLGFDVFDSIPAGWELDSHFRDYGSPRGYQIIRTANISRLSKGYKTALIKKPKPLINETNKIEDVKYKKEVFC